MALTEGQQIEVFAMFGVPKKDNYFGGIQLATIFGPSGEKFTTKAVKDELDAALALLTAAEELKFTEADGILEEWDCIKFAAENIRKDGTTEGQIFSHEAVREEIRQRAANIIGFIVPVGGFIKQFNKLTGRMRGGNVTR